MSRHIVLLESTPTAASGQLVTAVTAQPVNSSQHGVSAAGQLVIRFWAVTSWPCDELTGSLRHPTGAEVFGQFGISAEVSCGRHFGTGTEVSRPQANIFGYSRPYRRMV